MLLSGQQLVALGLSGLVFLSPLGRKTLLRFLEFGFHSSYFTAKFSFFKVDMRNKTDIFILLENFPIRDFKNENFVVKQGSGF